MIRTLSHAAHVNQDGPFGDRFWYWNGASGRRYIHSVFHVEECPPLPGAVYLAVRRKGCGERTICAIGRFSSSLPEAAAYIPSELVRDHGVNEVHVHLLAESEAEAAALQGDLAAALLADGVSDRARTHSRAKEKDRNRGPGSLNLSRWFPALKGMLQTRP